MIRCQSASAYIDVFLCKLKADNYCFSRRGKVDVTKINTMVGLQAGCCFTLLVCLTLQAYGQLG